MLQTTTYRVFLQGLAPTLDHATIMSIPMMVLPLLPIHKGYTSERLNKPVDLMESWQMWEANIDSLLTKPTMLIMILLFCHSLGLPVRAKFTILRYPAQTQAAHLKIVIVTLVLKPENVTQC